MGRQADDDDPSRLRDEADGGLRQLRHARRLEDDLRAFVARPLPARRHEVGVVGEDEEVGAHGARARRGSRRGRRAAPRRHGRSRRPRPPGRSGRRRGRPPSLPAIRARTIARTAIETGSIRAETAGSRSPTGNTWSAGTRTRSCSAPSRWIPTRLMFEHTLRRPMRQG